MNSIRVLSDELISQIAAGEVIERPASAVKELVENSLDAGASQISVEIEEGGMKKIRVVDDGCGISREDAKLAFERHATSKIKSLDDLFSIKSLGFRGEALASIASVARVELRTRQEEESVGLLVEMDGGRRVRTEDCASIKGTDICIYGLFHHTPARKKYMKSERTEYGHIFELISGLALAHPEVGFRVKRDNVEVLNLPSRQTLKERIRVLFGNNSAEALVPVQYQQTNLLIGGYVGKPELARPNKKYQFLFVNGRAIQNRTVSKAVQEAFRSLLMHEKYPWFALTIEIDPAFVDVNVHPRKLEVKFVNSQEVYRAVFGSVQHALEKPFSIPLNLVSPLIPITENSQAPLMQESFFANSPSPSRDFRPAETIALKNLILRPVAQIARSYIVAESEEGMVLIDQHAAHERVRYARFMKQLKEGTPWKQALLTPLQLDFGADGVRLLNEYKDEFAAVGFEIESFGGNSFLIRSVPAGLEKRDPERSLSEWLSELTQEWRKNPVQDKQEAILTMAACRGAIKFGDALTMDEMKALLNDMSQTPNFTHCPHGRPSLIEFHFDELETMFKRRNF